MIFGVITGCCGGAFLRIGRSQRRRPVGRREIDPSTHDRVREGKIGGTPLKVTHETTLVGTLFPDSGDELSEPGRLQSVFQKQIHITGILRLSPAGQAVGGESLAIREDR